MIVVDTNVVSELMRPTPSPVVVEWVRSHGPRQLVTTAVTLAEIRYGLARLPDGRRTTRLIALADRVFDAFGDYVLPFDAAAATMYSRVVTDRESAGRPISGFDAQIASICLSCDVPLATRNVRDFRQTRTAVIDPWAEA